VGVAAVAAVRTMTRPVPAGALFLPLGNVSRCDHPLRWKNQIVQRDEAALVCRSRQAPPRVAGRHGAGAAQARRSSLCRRRLAQQLAVGDGVVDKTMLLRQEWAQGCVVVSLPTACQPPLDRHLLPAGWASRRPERARRMLLHKRLILDQVVCAAPRSKTLDSRVRTPHSECHVSGSNAATKRQC